MKPGLSILFIAASFVGAIYVGFWLMFVGGIIDIIQTVKDPVIDAGIIAIGLLKVIFASFVGWFIFVFGFFVATGLTKK